MSVIAGNRVWYHCHFKSGRLLLLGVPGIVRVTGWTSLQGTGYGREPGMVSLSHAAG